MEYIPLKSPGGELMGHARVKDGFVEMKLRGASAQNALVLTETGSRQGRADVRIAANGRVTAVAAHENGRLICYGAARGAAVTPGELRRFLVEPAAVPAAVGAQTAGNSIYPPQFAVISKENARVSPREARSEAESEARAPQAHKPTPREIYHPVPETILPLSTPGAPAYEPPSAPEKAPEGRAARPKATQRAESFESTRTESSKAPCAEIFESPLVPERPAPVPDAPMPGMPAPGTIFPLIPEDPTPMTPAPGVPFPGIPEPDTEREQLSALQTAFAAPLAPEAAALPDVAESAADSESFFALLRRADEVYSAIRTPTPPVYKEASDGADAPEPPFTRFARGDTAQWLGEVEQLLRQSAPGSEKGRADAEAEELRTVMPNPFPHIFPGARFTRVASGRTDATERLEGEWRQGNERMRIFAVPGSYSPQPPAQLTGYTRFIRSRMGGFWVKVTQA